MPKPLLPAILSCKGLMLSDDEKYLFEKYNPVGINLFSRNIDNPQQLKSLVQEIKSCIGRTDVLIAIDQEGGRVRRLVEPHFRSYISAYNIGHLPIEKALRAAYLHTQLISIDLAKLGINLNYAPVLDISYSNTTPALNSRCLSSDPHTISTIGKIMVDTYIQNGILPCIKHIPGHGRAECDPHLNLPTIKASLKELEQDFLPFKNLNYCPIGMTAHIVLSSIDADLPITQSAKGIQEIIRKHIDFKGILISDAIDMHALHGSIEEKAINSLKAGCDLICYSSGLITDMQKIASSCPKASDNTLERFAQLQKILDNKPQTASENSLANEYNELIGSVSPYQEEYDSTEVLNLMMQKN